MTIEKISVRDKILDTAYSLFYSQGYNSTGINQIIAEAGIAKSSLYQHFRSKEELCVAYLNKRHDFWMESFLNYINTHRGKSGLIESHFDFLSYMNGKENFRGCAFINIISEIPIDNEAINRVILEHKIGLRQHFQTTIAETYPNTSTERADALYVLFEGAILESQIFRNNWPVEIAKSTALKLLNNQTIL